MRQLKIHYISDHAILEHDEAQLFLDLGYEVFSNGAYLDPAGHISHARPGLRGGKYYEEYANLARLHPRTKLPAELIDPFDIIIIMHAPEVVVQNWDHLKHKTVVWRSIGQSTPRIERQLAPMKAEGLKVVRYSPKERTYADYMGEDALIRFYKDEDIYKDWRGNSGGVITFAQSLKGRREFCHYDEIMAVVEEFKGTVYGPGNEDLGEFNGGQVPYEEQIKIMQKSGVMLYGGTWPACYTLSFIEALMTGIPVVAISKTLAHIPKFEPLNFYEVDELMAEISGAVCDTPQQMIDQTRRLLGDQSHAEEISRRQRELALKYFSKAEIGKQWREFLEAL